MAQALAAYADYLKKPAGERPAFAVDVWDGDAQHLVEVAQFNNLLVARAAFDKAVRQRALPRRASRRYPGRGGQGVVTN